MKKKFLSFILTVLSVCVCAFALTACDMSGGGSDDDGGFNGGGTSVDDPVDEHVHEYREIPDEEFLMSEATCQSPALYYYSCSCGDTNGDVFPYGEYGAHEYDYTTYESNYEYHWHKCKNCDETTGREEHSGGTATCEKQAICEVCGTEYGITNAEHKYAEEWSTDATYHWHAATCVHTWNKGDNAEHTFDGAKCSVCQYEVPEAEGLTFEFIDKDHEDYDYFGLKEPCYFVTDLGSWRGLKLRIPEKYNGYPVGGIDVDRYDFSYSNVEMIIIPDSVTYIDYGSFSSNSWLSCISVSEGNETYSSVGGILYNKDQTSLLFVPTHLQGAVTVPDTVTSIGDEAFKERGGITSVTIGNGVTSIGDQAFYKCTGLESVTIGNGVTSIGASAFYDCTSLESLTIPDSVTSIGSYAFSFCTSLSSATIGNGIKNVGKSAFSGCGKLKYNEYDVAQYLGNDDNPYFALITVKSVRITSGKINDKCKIIGSYAFNGCTKLESITIPTSVIQIGQSAFSNCPALTEAVIPNSVECIEAFAFGDCIGLKKVTLGSDVKSIGEKAFHNCTSLTSVYYNGTIEKWVQIDFAFASNPLLYAKRFYIGDEQITKITIEYAKIIKSAVFDGFHALTSVTIGESVETIEENAFSGCLRLVEVINNNKTLNIVKGSTDNGGIAQYAKTVKKNTDRSDVTVSGDYVFYSGELIGYVGEDTDLVLPSGNYKLYDGAFDERYDITSIYIPAGVMNVTKNAFYGCSSLRSITVADGNAECSSQDGILYDKDKTKVIYVPWLIQGSITIPGTVKKIADYDFGASIYLTEIVISQGTTEIGDYAFKNCSSLTSITIPNSVTSIGAWAFYGCSSLTSITIPGSVTSINTNRLFEGCSLLTSIIVASDNTAYAGQDGILYDKDKTEILFVPENIQGDLTLPDTLNSIKGSAFKDRGGLTSVVIPDSVTSIEGYAFVGCSGLTSVTIGKNVTSIGDRAFYGCSNLTSVVIPDSVETIGYNAFYNCSLVSVTIGENVTSIENYAFSCEQTITRQHLVEVINKSNLDIQAGEGGYGGVAYYALEVKKSGESTIDNVSDYLFYTFDGVNYLIGYLGNDTDLVLPQNYKGQTYEIYQCAFSYFMNYGEIKSVVIPDGVTKIGHGAFQECTKMVSAVIGDNVVTVEDRAFGGCSSLRSVTIGKKVENMYGLPFNGDEVVEVISKGDYDASGIWAAKDALSIKKSGESDIVNVNDYLFYTKDGVHYLIGYAGNDTDLVLPESYKGESYEIYKHAFYGSKINSVVISDGVTSIGEEAFEGCGLEVAVIGSNVTKMERAAFRGSGVKYVEFKNPNGWYISQNEAATSGDELSLTNDVTNADYLRYSYDNYYWFRESN